MDAEALYYQASPESAPGYSPEDLGAVLQDSIPGYDPLTQTTQVGYQSPQTGYTEEDMLAEVAPGYEAVSPEPEPAAPQSPASPPSSVTMKTGDKVSVSQKGYSPAKAAQIKRGPMADLERKQEQIKAEEATRTQSQGQLLLDADQFAADAIDNQAAAETEKIMERASSSARLAALQKQHNIEIEARITDAHARNEENMGRYMAALEDFKASGVNPGQLFQSMSKGEQIGTLASVFVHDCLGAKGIKTSALDTLNKGIERNLDA